jgi:hypothetical protein
MIINQSVGFTFIHIPKSAGTSVTQFLSPLNGPFDLEIGGTCFGEAIQSAFVRRHRLRKHSTLQEAWSAISAARPSHDMYYFTFVRHPFSRLSSIYRFLLAWDDYNPDLRKIMHGFGNYREFLNSQIYMHLPGPDGMFRPQSSWIKIDGKIFDSLHIFKLEDISYSLEEIKSVLKLRGATIDGLPKFTPHANKTAIEEASGSGLDQVLLNEVREFYSEDFAALGYDS